MGKARLGKGLGALFPEISSTNKENKDVENKREEKSLLNTVQKPLSPSTKEHRVSVPKWDKLAHPSDMFFSNTTLHSPASTLPPTSHAIEQDNNPSPVPGAYFTEISLDAIRPNAHQPRTVFNDKELKELADSIAEVGILEPVVVRALNESKDSYELIMGERRWRASYLAGKTTIPAIVRTTSDSHMLRDALLENLQRVQLNPLEEAAAYQQLMHDFGLTQEQLSKSISKSRPQIANTLRLLQLPGAIQKEVESGLLTAGHARALLSLKSSAEMIQLAQRIISEGLSVRAIEKIVATQKESHAAEQRAKHVNYWSASKLPQQLGDRFATKVEIRGTEKRGKIEISFSSQEELQRITELLKQ
ncbi:MAG: ParB/RepB/Spo0J family partition protein [Aeriscardovia sp.]|nr:ParB/RepB/Spo0J family partition protein [Aeriscardovia sp.]